MAMTYQKALEYIHGTHKFGVKLGLQNIKKLLELMGDPHKSLRFVHIAGTNGKGSVASYIRHVLIRSGYRTGFFISPYIERFTERIQVNHNEISEAELAQITERVKEKIDIMLKEGYSHPTEFEIVTAIGFEYFKKTSCDLVVLEVGLGGRYDSTNIIDAPEVSIITKISYDHTAILGDTLSKIAYEKAGIIKKGTQVVSYHQGEEAQKVIQQVCEQEMVQYTVADFHKVKIIKQSIEGQAFLYKGIHYEISLLGDFQIANAVVAIEAMNKLLKRGYHIKLSDIIEGLRNTRWGGRIEVLNSKPTFIIDAAHNPDGMKALTDTLKKLFPNKKISFIFGVSKDKAYKEMIEMMLPIAKDFYVVAADSERALTVNELTNFLSGYCKSVYSNGTIKSTVKKVLDISTENDVICAAGSLYFIGEIRTLILKFTL